MVKSKQSLKHRPKALFGADGTIMAVALGLQTVNDTVNTILQVNQAKQAAQEAKDSAKAQSDSIKLAAEEQAAALKAQSENNNKLQEETIAFTKAENEKAREIQKNMQMNMEMMMGKQNAADRAKASKITVKYGGNVRRKLKNGGANKSHIPFTGELGFVITDGAEGVNNPVIPLEITPDGGVIMMVNPKLKDHDEKNKEGRKGFGVATATEHNPFIPSKSNLEMEGGEIFKAKPYTGIESVISKHRLPGTNFNPAANYLAGGNYDQTFNIAEYIKNEKGISDSGNTLKRGKALNGTNLGINQIYPVQPNIQTDSLGAISTSMIGAHNNNNAIATGFNVTDGQQNQVDRSRTNILAKYGKNRRCLAEKGANVNNKQFVSDKALGWMNIGANAIGGINSTISNLLGSSYTREANREVARLMGEAYTQSGDMMANAYDNLTGIDLSQISRDSFRTSPILAQLRTNRVNKNAELDEITRQYQDLSKEIDDNTLSSAARQTKRLKLATATTAARNKVYQQQQAEMDAINNANQETINDINKTNMLAELQAGQGYTAARLEGLKYNADIANQRILGRASSKSDAILKTAGINANTALTNSQIRSNAVNAIANSWNNATTNTMNFLQGLNTKRQNLLSIGYGLDAKDRPGFFRMVGIDYNE